MGSLSQHSMCLSSSTKGEDTDVGSITRFRTLYPALALIAHPILLPVPGCSRLPFNGSLLGCSADGFKNFSELSVYTVAYPILKRLTSRLRAT